MLRILIATLFLLVTSLPRTESVLSVRRLTNTPEQALNLNLSLSDDGKTVVFELTSDLFGDPGGGPFHAVRSDLSTFLEISGDGSRVYFKDTDLFVMDIEARVTRRIASESEDFAVSRDGTRVASIAPRAAFGPGTITETQIAPGSIAHFRGSSLGFHSELATEGIDPPLTLAGTTVSVNGQRAQIFYVSPDEVVFVVPETIATGPGEVVVTNADGFASKADVTIANVAPRVFTAASGEGIILDSDTVQPAPFDPSNGQRRISIFATGVRHAKTLSVTLNDRPATVEDNAPANLAGLDEIHALLPPELSGAGSATLIVDADGVKSNPASVAIAGVRVGRVVISQVFGGGGNSGSPFRNDFIEIFNAGDTPVNLAGWSVQYASATASTWSATPLTSIALAPGQYYLVQQAGGSNGATLPAPDATGTIAMAAGAGKVAIVKTTTPLTGACPSDPNIVDLVGYGSTATCFRGAAPAPAASNTNAAARKTNGCTDTRNNATDFALATPNPRNSNAPFNKCTITQSVLICFPDALAQRRNHNSAPAFRLRRFP